MNKRLIAHLVLAVALSGASLLARPVLYAQSATHQLNDLTFKVKNLQADYEQANRRLARVKEQYRAGLISQGELDDAQAQADRLARELQKAQHDMEAVVPRAALMRPVTIQLDHASVQQFAAALSRAAGISVKVDKNVPANASTMLTLDAQGVPLANVLEAIAEKTDLMIAPDGPGVILKKWPHMNARVFRSATAPWSSEWGVPPTLSRLQSAGYYPLSGGFGGGSAGPGGSGSFGGDVPNAFPGATGFGGFGGGGLGGSGGGGPQSGVGGFPPQAGPGGLPGGFPGGGEQPSFGRAEPAPGGWEGVPGMRASLPFTMTSVGDHIIAIAEAGLNDRGEPGVWMTAYMFDGTGFHRMGQGFHPFNNSPRGGPRGNAGKSYRRGQGGTGLPGGKPSSGLRPPAGGGAAPSDTPAPGGGGQAPGAPAPGGTGQSQ